MNRFIQRQPSECDSTLVSEITEREGVSALTARALIRRGVTNASGAKAFLHPSETSLLDPYLLPDMESAVARIRLAISRKERVCIFGDYDADGVCATVLLQKRLAAMGANVTSHIPMRHSEGYGMTEAAVRKLANAGVQLIITVDNGVSAYQEIALCGALGMDVIVTDHHSAGASVPECVAVVTASRHDSTYPNPFLCGAGVAFKLIQALTDDGYTDEELALAAVATIADVVPLVGENRVIAACGLPYVDKVAGFHALLDAASWKSTRVDEQTVSFILAPRLNAAGRISSAMRAVELLTSDEEKRVSELAESLDTDNQKRKDIENGILTEAEKLLAAAGGDASAILLRHTDWNAGVIGIVASRLCETCHRPVILFSETDGVLTGSGRSIEGVDLYACLTRFADRFVRYGGHARAAGVTILAERYEAFRQDFIEYISETYTNEAFDPCYCYDEAITLAALTPSCVQELNRLAPYGEGNPEPVFCFADVSFASKRTMGKDERHFSASVVQQDHAMRIVAFGRGELKDTLEKTDTWELLARPALNDYRGERRVELYWTSANPKRKKSHFFDAFLEEYLYNSCCSDAKIAEWYFSDVPDSAKGMDRDYLMGAYRALQRVTGTRGAKRRTLKTVCAEKELLALCVFLQLGFFRNDTATDTVYFETEREARKLEESSLYRAETKI